MRNSDENDRAQDRGRHGSQINWLKDHKDRRYYIRTSGEKVYYDQGERDAAQEEQYSPCAQQCCSTLLARIAYHREEIVMEYLRWADRAGIDKKLDSQPIAEFEEERFGEKCFPAAHQLLMYEVKIQLFGDPYAKRKQSTAKPTPGLSNEERKERLDKAVTTLAQSKAMPETAVDEDVF